MNWILNLLIDCMHHSELHFTDHWHTHRLLSPISTSRFLATVSTRERFFSFPRSGLLITADREELLSTDTQLTGSQAGGYFTHTSCSSLTRLTFNWTELQLNPPTQQPATSYHFTQLNYWLLRNSAAPAYNISARTTYTAPFPLL
jgi:hypothetical protein